MLRILGAADVTSRGAASLLEVGETVTGWPQLGSEVTLGAATAAAAVRRIGLTGDLPSGRVRFDVEEILSGILPVKITVDDDLELEFDDDGSGGAGITAAYDVSLATSDLPLPEGSDPVEMIVDAARWAPSGGNIQPWRFEADANEIRMYLVPDRTTTMDVRHRGSYVAIGAALFNARVAAASLKNLGDCQLFPEGSPSHHVATLMVGDATDYEIAPLASRVRTRVANRRMGDGEPLDEKIVKVLTRGVEREGSQLHLTTDRDRIETMADAAGGVGPHPLPPPDLHREMVGELRFPGRDSLERGARRPHARALPTRSGGTRAAAPSRRDGASGRLAGRANAGRPHPGLRRLELGPGRGHRAAGRPGLVRPRGRRRGAPLAHGGAPRARRAARVPRLPLRPRRQGLPPPRGRAPRRDDHRPVAAVPRLLGPRRRGAGRRCCSA